MFHRIRILGSDNGWIILISSAKFISVMLMNRFAPSTSGQSGFTACYLGRAD